jgi:hypothetical protein
MVWKKKTHLLVLNLSVDEQKTRGWRKQPAKSPLPSVKPPPVTVGITASVPVEGEPGGGRMGLGGNFWRGEMKLSGSIFCFDSKKKTFKTDRGCGVVAGIQNRHSTRSSHRFALVAQRWVFGAWVRRIWVFLALHFNTDAKEKKETSHTGAGGGEPCDGGREKMGLGRKWGEMKMGIAGMGFVSLF